MINKKESNHSPIIYTKENIKLLKSVPILEDEQIYIYAMLNSPQGNVKIGKTTDIIQRLKSLSGSNGAGNKIVKLYCSPATWIQSLENTCHDHYNFARIQGTEWFDGNKVDFEEVVNFIDNLFYTDGYERCNELRKRIVEEKKGL